MKIAETFLPFGADSIVVPFNTFRRLDGFVALREDSGVYSFWCERWFDECVQGGVLTPGRALQ